MTDSSKFDCSDPQSGHGVQDMRDGLATPVVVALLAGEVAAHSQNTSEVVFWRSVTGVSMTGLQSATFWKCDVCGIRPGVEYLKLHGFMGSDDAVIREVETPPSRDLLAVALMLVLSHGRVPAEMILGVESESMREEYGVVPGEMDEFLQGLDDEE